MTGTGVWLVCVSMYYVYENGCCTCYIFVSDSIDLVMLMMMEGPERGLVYAIETLTTVGNYNKNRFGDSSLLICVKHFINLALEV